MGLNAQAVIVALGAVGAAVLVAALARRLPPGAAMFERSLRPPARSENRPAQLVRVEQIVRWAGTDAADVHGRLRPLLVEIAVARLARRGVTMDAHAAEVERLLGPVAWELVRPDRPSPRNPEAPGLAPREIESVVDALEAV